jgi:hypothetical protein
MTDLEYSLPSAALAGSSGSHSEPTAKHLLARVRTRAALCAAGITLLVSWAGLLAVHHTASLAVPRVQAIAAVEHTRRTRYMLAHDHWTRVEVLAIDRTHDSVWFYDGARLRATAIVAASGRVEYAIDVARLPFAFGSNIANAPLVLCLLSAVFVLMTGVWPLWRVRNLDALAMTAGTASIVLLNETLVSRMVLVGSLVLVYLGIRCAWRALGPPPAPRPAVPLFERLTSGWDDHQRVRLLRLLGLAAALTVAMIGMSSLNVVDVGWAVMEGATDLVHGVVPYGHVTGVLHGDTYPIGSYLLYTPAAWLSPVRNIWDDADPTLAVAVLAALAAALALWRSLRRPQGSASAVTCEQASLRAAVAWLTFPALLVTVGAGSTDIVLGAILLAAILLWRRPTAASALLAAGAWFKLLPLALVPLVLAPLRGRRLLAAVAAGAAVSVGALLPLLALGGPGGIGAMVHAIGYQTVRLSPQSPWALVGSVPLQQLVQAATLALIVGAAVRLWRDPALALDRTRIAALVAAVMIALQLSASYWSYMYFVWALPGVMLSLLWWSGDRARQ